MDDDLLRNAPVAAPGGTPAADVLAREFARTFESASGKKVLEYLRSVTLGRYLGPGSSNEELRYLEGQRYLVSFISNMVRKGKAG
jgi:hypothetical protein